MFKQKRVNRVERSWKPGPIGRVHHISVQGMTGVRRAGWPSDVEVQPVRLLVKLQRTELGLEMIGN